MTDEYPTYASLSHHFDQIALGNPTAFAALYDGLAPTVHGIATAAATTPEDVDAITVSVFVFLWRHAVRLDKNSDLRRVAAAAAIRAAVAQRTAARLSRQWPDTTDTVVATTGIASSSST